jgi:hypothetical protein
MKFTIICFSSLLILGAAPDGAFAEEVKWTPLFDGKSVDGWIKRGGKATYSVEDGAIVGTSTLKTENTFLCTPRDYGDFILEYEFKVDPRLNSGVQIRSQCFPKATKIEWQKTTLMVPANRVHGYQIEIDPDPVKNRWWSAGIYEEAARGWLFPGSHGGNGKTFGEEGGKIFKQGDWNKVRVEARGASLKTFLNDAPRAAIKDARVLSGFIGLQVHGIGNDKDKEGTQVRWRNLRIQEIPAKTLTADER